MRFSFLVLSLLLWPAIAHADTAAQKLKVVASFSILGDMVHQVGGDDIELETLIGPNSDAHAFTPAPADAAKLAGANLIIINGMGFEGWLERLIASSGYKGKVVSASDGILPLTSTEAWGGHHHQSRYDFHAWQDAHNGIRYIANIRDALSAADPVHTLNYQRRAHEETVKLTTLDGWIKSQIAQIAPAKRKLITTHDAFGYYARAYGLTFITPLGISTDSEPSAADIARLIDLVRARQVHTVFLENIANDRLMHQLEQDAGATIGGTLYSDALSDEKGPAPTYLALLRYNTEQLVSGMKHNR